MKCADCKWWARFEEPFWAKDQPARWQKYVDRGDLFWGECGRSYNDGYPTRLMEIECSYSLFTHETFGCVQFEAK